MSRAAIFWDRDDTLVRDPGYLSDPDQVELLPGAAEAVRRLGEAGFENIIVTNQSGVARGLVDEPTLERIHERLREKLAEGGGRIDALYYCPYLEGDEAVVEAYRRDSDLRKPKPGMLLQAAAERDIDLPASWVIGNSIHDAQAGRAAGCRTILISFPAEAGEEMSGIGGGPDDVKRSAGSSGAKGGKRSGGSRAASASQGSAPAKAAGARNKSVDFVVSSLSEAVDIVLRYRPNNTRISDSAGADQEPAWTEVSQQLARDGVAPIAPESGEGGGVAKEPRSPAVAGDPVPVLQEILALLRVMDRRARTEEFTLAGLAGAVVQVLALAALVWALFAYLWNEPLGIQLVRLGFAMLLQLLALTFLVIGSRK